jgi:hypothetical protein
MKTILKITSLSAILLSLIALITVSCEKEEDNQNKIRITEGIWGTLLQREGDCMPGGEVRPNPCKIFPVKREVWVYEYAIFDKDVVLSDDSFVFFKKVNTQFVAKTISDKEGFFELALKPGKYSVFIKERGLLYASSGDGQGGISPVIVEPSKVSEHNLEINYAYD